MILRRIAMETDSKLNHLDIGSLMASGLEPYPLIMDRLQRLDAEERIILHVPFEPKPLMKQLLRMGFKFDLKKEAKDQYLLEIFQDGDRLK